MSLHIVTHPLVQHKLTIMRKTDTSTKDFRKLLDEITLFLGYEATKDLLLDDVKIQTPIKETIGQELSGRTIAIVPILRAGLGMVNSLLELIPCAKVGHIGLYRDENTHTPVFYYCKLPDNIDERIVIVCDPMLATGGSASDAISMLKDKGCKEIKLVCLVSAPEGVAKIERDHPDVDVFTASLDEGLNNDAYIVPGLGDAGDRLFGTN